MRGVGTLAALLSIGCYAGLDGDPNDNVADSGADDAVGDGDGDGAGDGADDGDEPLPDEFEPGVGSMRRLTTSQYHNSIRDIFGLDIAESVALDIDETSATFRSIGASSVGTSPSGVEMYRAASFEVTAQVFDNRDAYPWLAGCTPASGGDACVRDALATVGRRLWRRPLEDAELDRYAALVDAMYEDGQDPDIGFRYAVAALLESPNFIYMPAIGEIAPNGLRRFTSWEVASRLSYSIWNSTPDDALLDAAAENSLVTADGIEAQTRRMLEDEKAADLLVRLFGEAWNVERLSLVSKNPDAFPDWSQDTVNDFNTEFRLVMQHALDRDADTREFFNGSTSFANPALAQLYGVPPGDPAQAVEGEFAPIELGDRRFGLLTSGAVLAANSPSDRSSPTIRGVFVLERLLCGEVPPPPEDVDDTLPAESDDPKSTRDRLEEHRENPVCASCHDLVDPLGLVLEHYDGAGAWRDDENGFEIDPSGQYEGVTFSDAGDLAAFLADDPRVTRCIARHGLSFATGRHIVPGDAAAIAELDASFIESGYQMRELIVNVVTSATFRYFTTEADQ